MKNNYNKQPKKDSINIEEWLNKDQLEKLTTIGFLEKLKNILEIEAEDLTGRKKYDRSEDDPIYRNDYSMARKLTIGNRTVKKRAPHLREPYESMILGRNLRRSKQIDEIKFGILIFMSR